jgi:hypothetical protein
MARPQSNQRLVNSCRWSSSRESTFHECQKKYWYSYYGSWEGWPKTPFDTRETIDPLASYLYMLKNMQPACMFMGSLVHKVIEECLKTFQRTKKIAPLQDLLSQTSLRYDTSMKESKEQLWKTHPKHHTNIFEHFYGLPFDADEERVSQEKALACITNWYSSPCLQNIALNPKSEWMGIESTQTFSLEQGVEAIVVYDFFLRWPKADGSKTMIIFDWKTGQESKKVEDQLFAYALAGTTLFSVPLDNIIVSPFYLAAGPSGYKKYGAGQEITFDASNLAATRSRIIESAQQMLLLHPPKNEQGLIPTPDPTLFSYPDDRRGCRRCPYQQLCIAADFQQKAYQQLQELIPRVS